MVQVRVDFHTLCGTCVDRWIDDGNRLRRDTTVGSTQDNCQDCGQFRTCFRYGRVHTP